MSSTRGSAISSEKVHVYAHSRLFSLLRREYHDIVVPITAQVLTNYDEVYNPRSSFLEGIVDGHGEPLA